MFASKLSKIYYAKQESIEPISLNFIFEKVIYLSETYDEMIKTHREEITKQLTKEGIQLDPFYIKITISYTTVKNNKINWVTVQGCNFKLAERYILNKPESIQ